MATLRSRLNRQTTGTVAGIGIAGLLAGAAIAGSSDPGADYHDLLAAKSQPLFGFGHPLDAGVAGAFDGPGDEAVELAKGLTATLVTDAVGRRADMIALWPDDSQPDPRDHLQRDRHREPERRRLAQSGLRQGHGPARPAVGRPGDRHDDRPQRVRPRAPDGLGDHPRRGGERRHGPPVGDPRPARGRRRDRQSGRRDDQRSRPRRRPAGARPAQLRGRRAAARRDDLLRRRAAAVERARRRRRVQVHADDAVGGRRPDHQPRPVAAGRRARLGPAPRLAEPELQRRGTGHEHRRRSLGAADHARQPAHVQPRQRRDRGRRLHGLLPARGLRARPERPGRTGTSGSAGTTPATTGPTSGARRCA